MKKKRKKQNKAWNIIPVAAITIFIIAGIIKICLPPEIPEITGDPSVNLGGDQQLPGDIPVAPSAPAGDPESTPAEPNAPAEEPNAPTDEPETPTEEPDAPAEEPETPAEEPETPSQSQTPEKPQTPEGTGEAYADVWSLILVNPTHSLPDGYKIELETVQGKYQMDSRAAGKAKEMIAAAKEDGVTLQVCSAYRSHSKQTTNFNTKLQSYLDKGWSYDEAYAKTATIIAVPGTSEHETGLALDIVTPSYQVLDAGYADTAAAKWLLENAADYGFILRFPKDKQDITKIIFEPWHYRYVGTEYSSQIMDSGLCLEEWLGQAE